MIDIGVNLTNSQLVHRVPEVLASARQAGVNHCVITGTDLDSSKQAVDLVQDLSSEFPNMLSCTLGVHPHDAKEWTADTSAQIIELAKRPGVVAIGETGLDFNRNYSPKEAQISVFEAQLELGSELQLPLFLHERDAFDAQIDILKNYRDHLSDAVIHCFTGDKKALFAYLDLDIHIGITGWVCDERRGTELADIVSNIPLNRLMIETDAPFLLPRNIVPKPDTKDRNARINVPANLPWVVKKLAACFETTELAIAQATSETARRFFQLEALND